MLTPRWHTTNIETHMRSLTDSNDKRHLRIHVDVSHIMYLDFYSVLTFTCYCYAKQSKPDMTVVQICDEDI